MNTALSLFFITLPLFMALDILWLGFVMRDYYRDQLELVARFSNGVLHPNLVAMLLVYVVISVGVVAFAILPYVNKPITLETFAWGAFYGFVGYGLYELTNYAVLKDWPVNIVFVDIAWGTVINGVVTVLVIAIARYFKIG